MLALLIPYALIAVTALTAGAYFKTGFAKTLPPVIFSVILSMYVFYISDVLHTGRIVVILALLTVSVLMCVRMQKNGSLGKDLKEALLSPPFLIFLVLSACFAVVTSGNSVSLWDSLRLWGAYPKALWKYETLQLGGDAAIYGIMQSYQPGMPLLCWFMTSFGKTFCEPALFFTYCIFETALLLPLTDSLTRRVKYSVGLVLRMAAAAAALFLVPLVLFGNLSDMCSPYASLFIDIPLGILAGYYLALCFNRFDSTENRGFYRVCIALSGACLVLLKDSGILFSICGVVGGLLISLTREKDAEKRKRTGIFALAAAAAFAAPFLSWRLLLGKYSVTNHLSDGTAVPGVSDFAKFVYKLCMNKSVMELNLDITQIKLTLPAVLLIFLAIKFFTAALDRDADMKAELFEAAVCVVCCAIFTLGYLFIFCEYITADEYPSYSRYMSTVLGSWYYIAAYDVLIKRRSAVAALAGRARRFVRSNRSRVVFGRVFAAVMGVLLLVIGAGYAKGALGMRANVNEPYRVEADRLSALISDSIPAHDGTAKVYLCIPGDIMENSRLHHRTYFELLSDDIKIGNFYTETDITGSLLGYSPEEFMNALTAGGYDYVVFTEIDRALQSEYSGLLGAVNVGDKDLVFAVDRASGSLLPVR